MPSIAVIIPALNEAGNICPLVEEIRTTEMVEVIVVDNGSADDTAYQATLAGARVINEPRRGYGFACAAGVAAAQDVDILVFIVGEAAHLPVLDSHIVIAWAVWLKRVVEETGPG